jgi:hypothetical protein
MDNKLYPPQLNGNLPAFCEVGNIIIPYGLNKAVGIKDFNKIHLMIKKVSTNLLVNEYETEDFTSNTATF